MANRFVAIKPVSNAIEKKVLLSSPLFQIVYVGQTSILFSTPTRALLPITKYRRGISPEGLLLAGRDFHSLVEYLPPEGSQIQLSELFDCSSLGYFSDLTIPVAPLNSAFLRETLYHLKHSSPGSFQFAQALESDNRSDIADLVGAGVGATPSGDDILTGAISATIVTGQSSIYQVLTNTVSPLLRRTTCISEYQLRHAIDGRLAYRQLELVRLVARQAPLELLKKKADLIGHTSGWDFLLGFLVQAKLIVNLKENLCPTVS